MGGKILSSNGLSVYLQYLDSPEAFLTATRQYVGWKLGKSLHQLELEIKFPSNCSESNNMDCAVTENSDLQFFFNDFVLDGGVDLKFSERYCSDLSICPSFKRQVKT